MIETTTALVAHSVETKPRLTLVKLDPLRAGEVLVRIHATGVCHTDLACMNGKLPVDFPGVFGHEGAGVILEVGKDVTDVDVGDKVLLSYNFCGQCSHCSADFPAYCEKMLPLNFGGKRLDGSHTIRLPSSQEIFSNFFGQSSFAHVAVVSGSSVVRVPPTTDLQLFAPLGCGFQTGAGAILNTLNVQAGSSVVISGTGCVGLSGVMAAKIREARVIVAVDIMPQRLGLARELGATHTLRGDDTNLQARIREVCGSPHGADFALDCSGVVPVIEDMIASLGIRGKGASVGAPSPEKKAGVDVFGHLTLGRQYVGCHQGDAVAKKMIPYLINQHSSGNFPLEKLITFYNAEDSVKAFHDMKDGKTLKPVLRWV